MPHRWTDSPLCKRILTWRTLLALFVTLEALAFTTRHFSPLYSDTLWPQLGMPLTVAFAALALVQVGLRRPGMLPATLYFVWYIGVLVLNRWFFAYEHADFQLVLYRLLFTTLVCYPLGYALVESGRERTMRAVLCAIVAWFAVWSALSVYCAATGTLWQSPYNSQGALGIRPEQWTGLRLYMFAHPNIAAAALMMTAQLSVFLWLTAKRRASKVWHAACCLLLCLALALTKSRTSMFAFAVGMSLLPFVWIRRRMHAASPGRSWVIGVACAGLTAVLCFAGLSLASLGMDKLSQALYPASEALTAGTEGAATSEDLQSAEAGASAGPEADSADRPAQRGLLEDLGTFNSRTRIWGAALRAIAANPRLLLKGATVERIMLAVSPYVEGKTRFSHLHNSFLEVLVGMGLPGLGLLLALLWVIGRFSLRLLLDTGKTTGLGMRFLPAVLLSSLITALMEPFYFTGQYCADRLFFLVAGLIVVWARKLK